MWREMRTLAEGDERMADAVQEALSLASASRADSTIERYLGALERFVQGCVALGMSKPFIPATSGRVAAYLAHLHRTSTPAPATVRVITSAISWAHAMKGWPNPCNHPVVDAVVEGIKRAYAKLMRKKKRAKPLPLLPEQLQQVVAVLLAAEHRVNLQVATMLALTYPAMLRFSEVRALTWADLAWRGRHVVLSIPRSKTNQYGTFVDMRPVPLAYGSVNVQDMLHRYVNVLGFATVASAVGLMWPCLEREALDLTKPMVGRTAYAVLRAAIGVMGEDPTRYTWHSCRAGAATGALLRDVPREMVMKVGNWRSDAVDLYQRPDEAARLIAVEVMLQPALPAAAASSPVDRAQLASEWDQFGSSESESDGEEEEDVLCLATPPQLSRGSTPSRGAHRGGATSAPHPDRAARGGAGSAQGSARGATRARGRGVDTQSRGSR